jgi:hypothetical protein
MRGFFVSKTQEINNARVLAGNRKLRLRVWAPLLQKPCNLLWGFFVSKTQEINNARVLAGNRKLRLRVWAPLLQKPCNLLWGFFVSKTQEINNAHVLAGNRKLRLRVWHHYSRSPAIYCEAFKFLIYQAVSALTRVSISFVSDTKALKGFTPYSINC